MMKRETAQRIILDIATALYFVAKQISIPLVQEYAKTFTQRQYNLSETSKAFQRQDCSEKQTGVSGKRLQADQESSLLVMYLNVAELCPAVLMVLILGTWSDVSGKRKVLMWLPALGNAAFGLCFMLTMYVPADYAMGLMFGGALLSGLSGNMALFFSGNACFISDTDSEEHRTKRLAIVELIVGVTFAVSNLATGLWIGATGFLQPFAFMFACSLLTVFVIVIGLYEPNSAQEKKKTCSWVETKSILSICSCSSRSRIKFWVLFFAYQLYVFVQQGQERTIILYLSNPPFCWTSVQIGLILFVLMTVAGLGSYPGIPLLQKCSGDVTIFMLALASKAAGSLILAFSKNYISAYAGVIVQVVHLAPYAVARSEASKQVGVDEQGSVYALIHSIQSMVNFLGPLTHNAAYAYTFKYFPGLTFLTSGSILVVPMALLLWVWCMGYTDKEEKDYNDSEGYPLMQSDDTEEEILWSAKTDN